jgi:hypothetical protein
MVEDGEIRGREEPWLHMGILEKHNRKNKIRPHSFLITNGAT